MTCCCIVLWIGQKAKKKGPCTPRHWHLSCLIWNWVVLFRSTRRLKSLNTISIKINDSPLEHANTFKYLEHKKYLQVQQNKAAKLILDKPKYSSATEALEELEWKHLDHRRYLHRCVFIFRCLHKIIDFNFNFKQNNAIHRHNTRQRKNLHLPAPKTNWAKRKITYQAACSY